MFLVCVCLFVWGVCPCLCLCLCLCAWVYPAAWGGVFLAYPALFHWGRVSCWTWSSYYSSRLMASKLHWASCLCFSQCKGYSYVWDHTWLLHGFRACTASIISHWIIFLAHLECVCVCTMVYSWSEEKLWESILFTMWCLRLNLSCQAWWQAFLPSEPSHLL